MMINDTVTVELRRTGPTAIVKLTVMKHAVDAPLTLPELETLALYLASQVGCWRNDTIEAMHTQQDSSPSSFNKGETL
jgi:hypothetical protein